MQKTNTDQFMDIPMKLRKRDEDVTQEVEKLLNGQSVKIFQSLDIEQRNKNDQNKSQE